MATIVIKDLSDNLDLDRKAMQAITGGARLRSRMRAAGVAPVSAPRIVDFHTGLASRRESVKPAK
ncbi:hypothetical protein ACI48D_06255 [Massilia sp. LXY-6]|uniref:hypothetical protein n=1 Tax=Massilia sp. LXY-6 TaxID=3379823 RepID=UPI003EE091BB